MKIGMKATVVFELALVFCATKTLAGTERIYEPMNCLSAASVNMPDQKDVVSRSGKFIARICYRLQTTEVDGRPSPNYEDKILLLENSDNVKQGKLLTSVSTSMATRWGRIDSLTLDKETPPYLSLRYVSGEFCEGLVVFQTKPAKVLHVQGCEPDESSCRMVRIGPKGKGKCSLGLRCGSFEEHKEGKAKSKEIEISC